MVITPKKNSTIEEFKITAKKAFQNYRKKYVNYFNLNKKKVKEKKTMLDTSPRVILVQNIGMFSVGKDLKSAKIAGDLTETNARVISSVEETSKYKFISKDVGPHLISDVEVILSLLIGSSFKKISPLINCIESPGKPINLFI